MKPAKNAVKCIECISTTMADIFLAFIQMAAAIKALPTEESEDLREFYKNVFNFIIIDSISLI